MVYRYMNGVDVFMMWFAHCDGQWEKACDLTNLAESNTEVKWNRGRIMSNIMFYGHIYQIRWAMDHGFTIDSTGLDYLAVRGHIHVMQWLDRQGLPYKTSSMYVLAAENGHLDVIKYGELKEHIDKHYSKVPIAALLKKQANVVRYFKNFEWYIWFRHFIVGDRSDLFQFLHDNGIDCTLNFAETQVLLDLIGRQGCIDFFNNLMKSS